MLALRLLRNRCIDTVFLLSLNLTDYSLHLFFRCKFEFEFEFEFSIGLSTVLYLADVSQTRGNGSMYHVQHVISFLSLGYSVFLGITKISGTKEKPGTEMNEKPDTVSNTDSI